MRRLVLAVGAIGAIGVSAMLAAFSSAAAQANAVPAATTHPVAAMTVSPTWVSVAGDGPNSNCIANLNGSSFTCTIHLHETAASTEPLTWVATTAGTPVVTYTPASGTLHPGQSVTVKAVIGCFSFGAPFIFVRHATGLLDNGAAVLYSCG